MPNSYWLAQFKDVRTQKVPMHRVFFKLATQKGNDILLPRKQKKLGVTDFVLERTCFEKYPKSEKSLADKATVCKPQNTAIRSLK